MLTTNHILSIQNALEQNNAGFRRTPGTNLVNQQTNEVVYTPPQHPDDIINLMSNLVAYINDDSLSDADPLMQNDKQRLRSELPNIYSQDLINNLFRHPYTKIEFLMAELGVSNRTAMRYLEILEQHKFVEKIKVGRSTFYVNVNLFNLFVK